MSALRHHARIRSALAALRDRTWRIASSARDRLRRSDPWRHVRGDPRTRGEHLHVAAALGGASTVAAVLVGAAGLVVSPVVWDAVFLGGGVALAALIAANGYWYGGLAAAYALFLAPLAGATVGTMTVGAFTGFGFVQVTALLVCILLVPVVHGAGLAGRRLREVVG